MAARCGVVVNGAQCKWCASATEFSAHARSMTDRCSAVPILCKVIIFRGTHCNAARRGASGRGAARRGAELCGGRTWRTGESAKSLSLIGSEHATHRRSGEIAEQQRCRIDVVLSVSKCEYVEAVLRALPSRNTAVALDDDDADDEPLSCHN